ncbi:alpha/beta hydrolase [Rhizobium sp. L1K21]|uniref:alpha/beta hydrolase n=1 Tax=Rhizobium sp. L1K21 TaxID=2954933 RepID=UPI002093F222|nr:alpha/beta fold hydrolase [Rhizobium sp. L1K21]MCO6188072.1 lysophospholipase [Rhizobium sp. L1K21]
MHIVIQFALISVAIFFVIAFGLILSQPASGHISGKTLQFEATRLGGTADIPLRYYEAGDGTTLGYRYLPGKSDDVPLLVFVHGSGWHGQGYVQFAEAVHGEGDIAVALPDLRGHGPHPQRRGDVNYIGQLEDDIAELISILRHPGQKLVLGGHSSGGGLVIRYAGGRHGSDLDQAVLIAPFLKYNAPTMRPNSGGWAHALVRRIAGLKMLNMIGISQLNGLTAIEFNFPDSVLQGPLGATATQSYSYRLNESYAPRADYLKDVAALPPFLLIAGRDDEAFQAEAYQPTLSEATEKGRYVLLDKTGHLDVYNKPETAQIIRDFVLGKD